MADIAWPIGLFMIVILVILVGLHGDDVADEARDHWRAKGMCFDCGGVELVNYKCPHCGKW